MQEKDHIKELFSETFKNYEIPVKPELWSQLSDKLGNTASPSVDPSAATEVVTTVSNISGSIITWVAGTAIVVSTAVGIYFYQAQEKMVEDNQATGQTSEQVSSYKEPVQPQQLPDNLIENNQINSSQKHGSDELKSDTPVESVNNQSDKQSGSQPATTIQPPDASNISTSTTTNHPVTGTQKNNPSSTQPATKDGKASDSTPNISRLKADPMTGTAPLSVSFYQNSDAENVEWNFGDGQTSNLSGKVDHTFTTPGSYEVTLKSTDKTGKKSIEKIKIEVNENLTIHNIPNIFTPNQDGKNDFFTFEAGAFIDVEVNIYDKSGKFVHRFTDAEKGWDGKLNNGQDVPEGTYFYIIFAATEKQQKHHQKGTITIRR